MSEPETDLTQPSGSPGYLPITVIEAKDLDLSLLIEIKDLYLCEKLDAIFPQPISSNTAMAARISLSHSRLCKTPLENDQRFENELPQNENDQKDEKSKGNTAAKIANMAMTAMSIATVVSIESSMAEIQEELTQISTLLAAARDILTAEIDGKIKTLIDNLMGIYDHQAEILNSGELRAEKNLNLDRHRTTCMDLLNQADLIVQEKIKNEVESYKDFEKTALESEPWIKRQTILLRILIKIDEYEHLLSLGKKSPELCMVQSNRYKERFFSGRERLAEWLNSCVKNLEIDVDSGKRTRKGWKRWSDFVTSGDLSPSSLISFCLNQTDAAKKNQQSGYINGMLSSLSGLYNWLSCSAIPEEINAMIREYITNPQNDLFGDDRPDPFKEDILLVSYQTKYYFTKQELPVAKLP